jgi:predicted CoA-binding protein
MGYGDEVTVRRLLRYPTWAVVGLSANPQRPSYGVARFLQAHGVRVIPVNPNCGASVLGERAYCALADIPDPVDVVDVFRRSEAAGAVADEAVAIGARGVWFQLDVVDHAAYDRVRAAGIGMVMDRCPAIEWPAHGPR